MDLIVNDPAARLSSRGVQRYLASVMRELSWDGRVERLALVHGRTIERARELLRRGREDAILWTPCQRGPLRAHNHVVTVHDTGEAQLGGRAVVYLVMELVEGTPLNRVLERGLPAVANVVRWGRQICSALEAAHSAGVVHRDVKPANVLLTGTGKIKLCDFGIARRPGGDRLTGTGMVVGTPSYMSPEQIRGQQVGPGSDLSSYLQPRAGKRTDSAHRRRTAIGSPTRTSPGSITRQ